MGSWVYIPIVAVLAGMLGGMGAGGGTLLIPALVFLFSVPQHAAQGVTLLAFIPTALVAAFIHWRQGFVRLDYVWRILLGSIPAAALGAMLATISSPGVLRKVFGGFILVLAVYAFFSHKHEHTA